MAPSLAVLRAAKRLVVLYHCPCPDGIFAATSANQFFTRVLPSVIPKGRPSHIFMPVFLTPGKDKCMKFNYRKDDVVFFCDNGGPIGLMEKVASRVMKVYVLDHHATTQSNIQEIWGTDLPTNVDISFLDMERSGASISRDFFSSEIQGTAEEGITVPQLYPEEVDEKLQKMIAWVEDSDLWRWALKPESEWWRAGFAGLYLKMDASKNKNIFRQILALNPAQVLGNGRAGLEKNKEIIMGEVKTARSLWIPGMEDVGEGLGAKGALAVETKHPQLRSSLGNQLATLAHSQGRLPWGLVVYRDPRAPGKVKISLRGLESEGIPTTLISEKYGGGGHHNASSLSVNTGVYKGWIKNSIGWQKKEKEAADAAATAGAPTTVEEELGSSPAPKRETEV